MAGVGYVLNKRIPIDIATLSKVQINVFVPGFMFVRVVESSLTWSQMGLIVGAMLLAEAALALPVWMAAKARGVNASSGSVLVLTSVVFNSGNFGIPLAERAYGAAGGGVQALVLMTANVSIWVLGYMLMASATHGGRSATLGFLKTPMFFALAAAIAVKVTGLHLPPLVDYPTKMIAAGLVPMALLTLGAQLATQKSKPNWRRVGPVVLLKLVALPAVMAAVVLALGLWPWPGAMLIVAASAPSAINTFLLALELDGDSDLAADCVFWTTLLAAPTVTLVLTVVKSLGGQPPGP